MARTVLLVLLLSLIPAVARAQTTDAQRIAAAQELYDQATTAMDGGQYAEACRKLEEVVRLVPDGLGAKLTLGECYLALGKRASAWSEFVTVEALARKAGQEKRAVTAGEKAAALKSALATLAIDVPPEVRAISGLAIARDDTPVGEVQWGTPIPVDAGDHTIAVTAPGRKPLTLRVAVKTDGDKVQVTVGAPPLEHEPPIAPPPEPIAPPPPKPAPPPRRPFQRPLGIAVMGVGAASLVVGAILGATAIARNNASNRDGHCDDGDLCDEQGVALRDQARAFATASTAVFVAGGVLFGTGVVVLATAPRAPVETKLSLAPGGLHLRGSW